MRSFAHPAQIRAYDVFVRYWVDEGEFLSQLARPSYIRSQDTHRMPLGFVAGSHATRRNFRDDTRIRLRGRHNQRCGGARARNARARDERAKRANRLGRVWLSSAVSGCADLSNPRDALIWPAGRAGMKGAGSLREARRRKHWTERAKRAREARNEARDRSDPGAFEAVFAVVVLYRHRSGRGALEVGNKEVSHLSPSRQPKRSSRFTRNERVWRSTGRRLWPSC